MLLFRRNFINSVVVIHTIPHLGYDWLYAISAILIFQPCNALRTCIIHFIGYERKGSGSCNPIPTRRWSISGGCPHQGENTFPQGRFFVRTSFVTFVTFVTLPLSSSSSIIRRRRGNSGGHRCGGDIPRFLSLNLFKGLVLDRDVKLCCFVSANRIFNYVQIFRHCLLMALKVIH